MKRNVLFIILRTGLIAFTHSAGAQSRYSLKPEVLDLTQCIAQPGRVPIPLAANGLNLEIVNWSAAPTPTSQPGEFLLKFARPMSLGSLMAYEPGEISYLISSNRWKPLPAGYDAGRKLQVIPFPPRELVEAIKFVVPAQRQPDGAAADAAYRATLPFVIFVPVRAINIASEATVAVSSADKTTAPSMPWLNRPETLVDGFVDSKMNFSTAPRDPNSPDQAPAWIRLTWDQPQSIRGLAFMHGAAEQGAADAIIEFHATEGDPLAPEKPYDWGTLALRTAQTGNFRSNQFGVVMQELVTRSLRLRSTNQPPRLSLGEIMILQDLGTNAAPERKAKGK